MRSIQLSSWCILALGALVCLGCGDDVEREPVYPVSGTVTRGGDPLAGAVVTFHAAGEGKAAVGKTDDSGKYNLTTWAKGDGAQAGKYQVTVTKYDAPEEEPAPEPAETSEASPDAILSEDFTGEYPEDYDEMEASEKAAAVAQNILPLKYANPQSSGLTAEVVADGGNQHDFTLDQ